MNETVKKIEQLVGPLLSNLNYELVDIESVSEHGKRIIRVYIDKENGVTLDDCETASKTIGDSLDNSSLAGGDYNLEVSSPGINRVLKKEKDFVRFNNSKVAIKLFAPVDGRKNLTGYLRNFSNGVLTIETPDKKNTELPLSKIAQARLEPDIDFSKG